jgi:ATP diphosphatase
MAALRTPVTGCPWDLEQNFATIAPYTIEEAYEVADAITRGDFDDLREEMGDLCCRSSITPEWRKSKTPLPSATWSRRSREDDPPPSACVRRQGRQYRRRRRQERPGKRIKAEEKAERAARGRRKRRRTNRCCRASRPASRR